mmetsp:Transcript_3879/g.10985  ORF Transcript_3879/g.10985 Transcript_3879/m.10985 type:complete len:299 (+) Transcript_3879:2293-3189(+)
MSTMSAGTDSTLRSSPANSALFRMPCVGCVRTWRRTTFSGGSPLRIPRTRGSGYVRCSRQASGANSMVGGRDGGGLAGAASWQKSESTGSDSISVRCSCFFRAASSLGVLPMMSVARRAAGQAFSSRAVQLPQPEAAAECNGVALAAFRSSSSPCEEARCERSTSRAAGCRCSAAQCRALLPCSSSDSLMRLRSTDASPWSLICSSTPFLIRAAQIWARPSSAAQCSGRRPSSSLSHGEQSFSSSIFTASSAKERLAVTAPVQMARMRGGVPAQDLSRSAPASISSRLHSKWPFMREM